MALWTPYLQETALDLSTNANRINSRNLDYTSGTPQLRETVYPYEVQRVPSAHTSPESTGSWRKPSPSDSPDFYATESLTDDMEYQAFERDALLAMAERNGGTLLGDNPRMRRSVQTSQAADASYRRQRERNNMAAKQSRDRRKLREVRLALQATFLKKKVAELKARLAAGVCGRCHQVCEC